MPLLLYGDGCFPNPHVQILFKNNLPKYSNKGNTAAILLPLLRNYSPDI